MRVAELRDDELPAEELRELRADELRLEELRPVELLLFDPRVAELRAEEDFDVEPELADDRDPDRGTVRAAELLDFRALPAVDFDDSDRDVRPVDFDAPDLGETFGRVDDLALLLRDPESRDERGIVRPEGETRVLLAGFSFAAELRRVSDFGTFREVDPTVLSIAAREGFVRVSLVRDSAVAFPALLVVFPVAGASVRPEPRREPDSLPDLAFESVREERVERELSDRPLPGVFGLSTTLASVFDRRDF